MSICSEGVGDSPRRRGADHPDQVPATPTVARSTRTADDPPADPVFDPFWSRVNEAGVRLAVHLGGTDYQKYGADWSEDPENVFGDFDAFQWVMYWGIDRPWSSLLD